MKKEPFFYKVRNYIFIHSVNAGLFDSMSDEKYLKMLFRRSLGYKLDLNNPHTFNEKLQWLKLHDRKDIYTIMADKYAVKEYVAGIIGEEHIIPTLGVWDSVDDIDFASLPEKFVLKCTHDSGGVLICHNKAEFDTEAAKTWLRKRLKRNYYYLNREWPYKNVNPRIMAEQYMTDDAARELHDYKFWCFDGEPAVMFIIKDRHSPDKQTTANYYDMDFNRLMIINGYPGYDEPQPVPDGFEEMKRISAVLSAGIPHVRVDLYSVEGRVYFGEYTFFDDAGLASFEPVEWSRRLGDMIKLPG